MPTLVLNFNNLLILGWESLRRECGFSFLQARWREQHWHWGAIIGNEKKIVQRQWGTWAAGVLKSASSCVPVLGQTRLCTFYVRLIICFENYFVVAVRDGMLVSHCLLNRVLSDRIINSVVLYARLLVKSSCLPSPYGSTAIIARLGTCPRCWWPRVARWSAADADRASRPPPARSVGDRAAGSSDFRTPLEKLKSSLKTLRKN